MHKHNTKTVLIFSLLLIVSVLTAVSYALIYKQSNIIRPSCSSTECATPASLSANILSDPQILVDNTGARIANNMISSDINLTPTNNTLPLVFATGLYNPKGSVEDNLSDVATIYIQKKYLELAKYFQKDIITLKDKLLKTKTNENQIEKNDNSLYLIHPSQINKNIQLLSYNNKYYLDDNAAAITFYTDPTSFKLDSLEYPSISNTYKANLTGVTALTRKYLYKNQSDYTVYSSGVRDFLKDADITHVSSEVSVVPNCIKSDTSFCANEKSIDIFKDIEADVIELTGNHNNDFGSEYNTSTINKYKEIGIQTFGGGINNLEAAKPINKSIKNNNIVFLGYNYYDAQTPGSSSIATTTTAGSNPYNIDQIKKDIKLAKANLSTVIISVQYQECYAYPETPVIYLPCYQPLDRPDQQADFRLIIDAGADIVIGTQAHQPQTWESYNEGTIFYGLGNLFFDQTEWQATKDSLIISIYGNNNKIIQTRITPTHYESDLTPHIMDTKQRTLLLNNLNDARPK
jgi:poly-gamma-glutamate capsule biosynthesis protein CapA/YwtB (metallophosphatase superfamily)